MSEAQNDHLYEFIFRMAAEGIVSVDADGVCLSLNPAAASMLQLTPAEVIGKPSKEAFPKVPNLVRLLRKGDPDVLDVPLPMDRLAQGIGTDMPGGGRLILLHDVTEQRQLESRREALVKAIAHDLRNPLNALSGYADLISKFGDMNEQQTRFMTRIRQTSSKLWELTASLVNLAWIESGMPLQYMPFDLAVLIQQVIADLSSKAHSQQVRLVVSAMDKVPLIMGDRARIKQALAHLVENAIQYSPPESNVVVHAWLQDVVVYCSVADRGFGIAASEIELIWDRMWRSSDERVLAVPGGGIGLTYSRTVIERHGGDIWVESKLDQGTTFTFMLPLTQL